MSSPPAITGEGFNWGYFIGCISSGGSSGDGPTFPANTGANAFHLFDVETLWVFQDYNYNMIGPAIFGYDPGPQPYTPPFKFRCRFDGGYGPPPLYGNGGPIKLYRDGLIGRVVTFDDGSTMTIDATAFDGTGQLAYYNVLANPPTYVSSYSGMHVVS